MLVEDNELNAEIAEFMLTENGAKVETVNNGLEAVQHFEASEPGTYDVILMDVMMPVMDGLTATRTIRIPGTARCKNNPYHCYDCKRIQGRCRKVLWKQE